jgi:RNA ligase (TIGR02306 family)
MEMENSVAADRCLAQVTKVLWLRPIEGADRIELAGVLGWQVIVRKGDFFVGDLAVYFNIGSLLDIENPHTAHLQGKPLKTIKMRGVLSQGLLGKLDWFNLNIKNFKEDDDVTEILKVKKYVASEEMNLYSGSEDRAPWSQQIPKTDEPRIQNSPKSLEKLVGNEIIITQKYDGTSTTFFCLNEKFCVCSRNNMILDTWDKITNNNNRVYLEMANKYKLEDKMLKMKRNLAIQGETIGPKINGNKHKVKENDFYVFNIYDVDLKMYLSWDEIVEICNFLGIKTVPVVYRGQMKEEWNSVDALLKLSDSQKYVTGEICEGIVVKTNSKDGFERTSFKVISNHYLLKYKL